MIRVSTLSQSLLLSSFAMNIQARIGETQIQIASGQKSTNYAGLAPDASRLVSLESARERADVFKANIETVQTSLNLATMAVDTIDSDASDLRAQLASISNAQGALDQNVWLLADNLIRSVQATLNSKDDAGYLFSGVRKDVPPVGADYATINGAAPFPAAPAGGPPPLAPAPPLTTNQIDQIAAAYYQGEGGTSNLTVRIDDGLQAVPYGAKADEPGFKMLIAGLHMVRQANVKFPADPTGPGDIDMAYLQNGIELITKALNGEPTANYPGYIQGVRDVSARLSVANATLETARQKHVRFMGYAQTAVDGIERVDTAETVARLNADQVALQAAYATLKRLQDATLLNFLD